MLSRRAVRLAPLSFSGTQGLMSSSAVSCRALCKLVVTKTLAAPPDSLLMRPELELWLVNLRLPAC